MAGGRVLMLAHHFPPMGGSGSNRALAFARYLPTWGWRPTVITPGAAWAANRDDALLRELPRDVRVVRTPSFEPKPLHARGTPLACFSLKREAELFPWGGRWRGQLGHLKRFPDGHIGWLPFALAAARSEPFDLVYSSSGPFTSHLVGLLLHRATRKPWVAELRDGWYRWNRAIFPDYPAWRNALERRLEAVALRSADRVVLVTERMAGAFRAQYPDVPGDHFAVVSNGFDPAQFQPNGAVEAHQGWHLVHAGALYYGRSLTAFLEAAHALAQTDATFAGDFRLRLLGTLDATARAEIERSGLLPSVDVVGQTAHAGAIASMRAADALLLVANTTPGAEATVPGKLFEYLAVGRPVLAIAPRESATADVLRHTGGGWLGVAGDVASIACALEQAYHTADMRPDASAVAHFDRRRLARDLACLFDQVVLHAARRL